MINKPETKIHKLISTIPLISVLILIIWVLIMAKN